MESKSPKNSTKKTPKKAVAESLVASKAKTPKSASKTPAEKTSTAVPTVGEHRIVNMNQVLRAAIALKKHTTNLQSKPGGKNQLFAADHPVNVEILLHKIPIKANMKRKIIPVSQPIRDTERTEICIFVRDSKVAKHKLAVAACPNVKKVIALGKLRSHYNQYEARRLLAQSYDLFLCEDAILLDVCKQLGSSFLKIRKAPIAIKIGPTIADTVAKIRDSTLFELSSGVTQSYKIGHTGFSEQQLCKNFLSSIDHVVTLLPLGWSNVKQIALITTGCVPLPIYNNLNAPAPKERTEGDSESTTKRAAPSTSSNVEGSPAAKKAKVVENGKTVAAKKTEETPKETTETPTKKTKAETPKKNAEPASKPASATKSKKTAESTKIADVEVTKPVTPAKATKKAATESPAKSEKSAASTPKAASGKTSASPKATTPTSSTKASTTAATPKAKAPATSSTPKGTPANKPATPASSKSSTPAKTAKSPSSKTAKKN